jgi:hypothetical protein
MRVTYSALIALLVASAVPSVGWAQVLTPFAGARNDQRLDHVVPVATVNLVGDMVALADARIVQDPSGEPFVLGAATLDLRDPSHAKIVFTMTNTSETPIPWNTVALKVARVTLLPDNGRLFFGCSLSGRAGHRGTWQPGARVTVQVPIAPNANCLLLRKSEPEGFLVYAGRELPHPDLLAGPDDAGWREVGRRENALFLRAFEKLRSLASQ